MILNGSKSFLYTPKYLKTLLEEIKITKFERIFTREKQTYPKCKINLLIHWVDTTVKLCFES
jgi:hypothetical protein